MFYAIIYGAECRCIICMHNIMYLYLHIMCFLCCVLKHVSILVDSRIRSYLPNLVNQLVMPPLVIQLIFPSTRDIQITERGPAAIWTQITLVQRRVYLLDNSIVHGTMLHKFSAISRLLGTRDQVPAWAFATRIIYIFGPQFRPSRYLLCYFSITFKLVVKLKVFSVVQRILINYKAFQIENLYKRGIHIHHHHCQIYLLGKVLRFFFYLSIS